MTRTRDYGVVVIGVSAGGMNALSILIPSLPQDFPLPVVVVQHLHVDSVGFLDEFLEDASSLRVKEADDKEPLRPGTVYVAPADYHLLIEEIGMLSLSVDDPLNYSRPSIDVLFDSAAGVFGNEAIGIILTGANADGSQGLKRIKAGGGLAIVQDPATAEAEAMPRAAIQATSVDHVLGLNEIGPFLVSYCVGSSQDADRDVANCEIEIGG